MNRKYVVPALIAAALLIAGLLGVRAYLQARSLPEDLETAALQRDGLTVTVEASGELRSNQTAVLRWGAPGIVGQVAVEAGDTVARNQGLALLNPGSLPPEIIRAKATLLEAEQALDDLLNSQAQSAQARRAVEDARIALEDALNPEQAQAEALRELADAEKAVDDAELRYALATKIPGQDAIEQARANLLMAENILERTQSDIERVQKKLKKDPDNYLFFESRKMYKRILENLELKEVQDRVRARDAQQKYDRLLQPPDPEEVAVAEAELATAKARLEKARREYDRVKDGPDEADIAVLQARLEAAQREYERVKDGPPVEDIEAAAARVAAAQAALQLDRLAAPFAGQITQVFTEPGHQTSFGDPAFRLDDLSRLLVDLRVSEIDINKIEVGQEVWMSFESVSPVVLRQIHKPGQSEINLQREYRGRVVEVRHVGQDQGGLVTYRVTVEVLEPDELLKPGMNAEARIITENLQDVLLVPTRAIRFQGGRRLVWVLRNGEPVPVEIQTGAASAEQSQILGGEVQAGDQIILNPLEDWVLAEQLSGSTRSER